jgi:uncharacterized membrane protein YraQ (UPF0718 family)
MAAALFLTALKEDGRMKPEYLDTLKRTANSFRNMIPVLLGVVLLISLILTAFPDEFYSAVFTGSPVPDSLLGAVIGSVAAGNPVNSYIIGGELLGQGVSMAAVVAFISAWVTVGLIQFPAESVMLGRRFALSRNALSFLLAIVMGVLMSLILGVIL